MNFLNIMSSSVEVGTNCSKFNFDPLYQALMQNWHYDFFHEKFNYDYLFCTFQLLFFVGLKYGKNVFSKVMLDFLVGRHITSVQKNCGQVAWCFCFH
jgi:hypothetical protein